MTTRKNKIIAHHEAGHAVVARRLGVGVTHIALFPTDAGKQAVAMACSAAWEARESDVATRIAAHEKDATISFAGPQAQRKYRDTNIKRASRSDWLSDWQFAGSAAVHILLLKDGIEPSEDTLKGVAPLRRDEIDKCFNKLWAAAGELVDTNWPAIERVAAELLRQPLLDQNTLDALIAS